MATKLLVLLVLWGTAAAGPLNSRWTSEVTSSDDRDCALLCSGQDNKFRYMTDTTYIYQYEVNTETSMAGASEDSASLNIQTRAEIEVINSCEFSLNLKSTQVSYFDPYLRQMKTYRDSDFQQNLQRNILRFSYDNGLIKHVCPQLDEEPWVLNFKKGLLSAFQNSMKSFDQSHKVPEVDVTGHCNEVEYNVSKDWSWRQDTIDVTKSKNLLSCSKRDGFKSIIQMVPYTVPSEVQSLPIIKSTHTCEQKISSDRILSSSSCKETHVYVPFSNHESGGRTDVTQKLTFQTKRDSIDTLQGAIYNRQSLLFHHTNNDKKFLSGQESAEQKLKEICEQTTYDIRPETPRLFTELVQIIKTLDTYDLKAVYQKLRKETICPQNKKAQKFFLDALPVAGTPGTVSMMLTVFKQNEINDVEKQAWLLSLSLINEPSDEMMPLTLKLLEEPMTLQSLLPVSALVNNYCKKNVDCVDNYYISQLIDLLDEKINYYCSVNDKNMQLVLRTLRAIGNIGNTRKFVPTLDRCILSKKAPIEVKVSAVEAYRRIPCPDEMTETDRTLITVLQDKAAEPELRIASYQRLMRCPTEATLQLVARQLDSEDSEEVGEYIYSHLNNLKKTSDPHKQDIAMAVRRLTLSKKFDANMLRSSRNFESSILLNKFNLGYAADADLIWSKSSFMPRAVKANITLDLFGNSINLLDFGGRMEGIEYLITNLLGANKYMTKKDEPWSAEDLRLCLYGRIFGNELIFQHIEGDKDLPLSNIKDFNLPELLIKWTKKFDYDFSHTFQLLHGSWIIPTVVGLPLNITVNSSASIHLGVKGAVDFNKMLTRRRSFNIDIDTMASGGLEVTGSMIVDANHKKVGLRMRNTLHSALPFKAQSSLSEAQGFSFEVDTPEEKIELFNFKSQFFIIHDGYDKEQKMITENRKEFKKCTGSTLAKISGFEMCGDVQFPNASMKSDAPYFPLTGPSSISLVLNKKDTHSGYKVFAKWDKKRDHTVAQLQLNTPGSQVNRLISADVNLGYTKDKHVDIIVTSPWTNMNLNGKLILNRNVRRMVGSVRIDDEDYGLTTEVTREGNKKEMKFSPMVELTYKGDNKRLLSGHVRMAQLKDISLSLDLNGFDKPLGNVKGALVNTAKERRVSVELSQTGKAPYKFTAGFNVKEDKKGIKLYPEIVVKSPKKTLLSLSGGADYRFNKLFKGKANLRVYSLKPITLSTDLKKSADRKKTKTILSAKVKATSATINGDLTSNLMYGKKLVTSQFKLKYDVEDFGQDNVKWNGKFSDKSKKSFKQYKISSNLSFKKNSDYNLITAVDVHQKKETRVGMKVTYGKNAKNKNKQATIAIQFPNSIPNLKNTKLIGMIMATLPEKKWDMEMKLNHAHDKTKLHSTLNFHILPFVNKSTIVAESRFDPKDFALSGSYSMKNEKLYSLDLLSKMRNWNAGRWSVEATSPERNVKAKANLRNEKERMTADALVNWDAGKKKRESSEISLVGSYRNSQVKKSKLMKGSLELKTPFKNFENINLRMNSDQKQKQLKSNGRFSWGGKQKQVNVDLITSLPVTLEQVKLLLAVKSPFKGYRQFELDVDHVLNKDIMTLLRGKMNNAESELKIKGNKNINKNRRKLTGEISLKTPFRKYREIQMTLDHSDDYRDYKSTAGFVLNNKAYMADIDMTHDFNGKDAVNSGKLILTAPDQSIETTWSHHTENEMKKIASKLKSTSKNKELINVKVSGSYEDMSSAQLEVDMDTKWRAARKIGLQLNHNQKKNSLTSKVVFTKNRDKTGYDLELLKDDDYNDVNVVLFLNPLYKRAISLTSNVKYISYPMTASTQLEWAPRTRITFDGSLNAPSLDNFDLSSKLTTPFDNYENIHIKSSIKRDTSELIAHLNVDYAIKKMIDIETRYRNDETMKTLSAKMTSPWPYIESLYTGIHMDTNNKVELRVDFDLQSLDKYGSHISLFKKNSDLKGSVQIITPFEGYRSIEATGLLSTKRDSKRMMHLDFNMDKVVHSLDASYKMKLPILLSLNIRTPYPEFDDVGLVFNHDMSEGRIICQGSLTYLPQKTFDASINFVYTPKIDGSLILKTPFENFEENKLNILFDGKMQDFTSHASVLVATKHVSYDLNFKNTNYRTSGDLAFISPIEGFKKVTSSFMMRGKVQNLKGEASLKYGDEEFSTEFSNRMKRDSAKLNFMLVTPYLEKFRFSFDHEDKNTRNGRKIHTMQFWKYGKKHMTIEADIDHIDLDDHKSFINVTSSCECLFRNVTISLHRKAGFVDFSWIIDPQARLEDVIGLFVKSNGNMENLRSSFNLTWQSKAVLEITVETNKKSDTAMDGKFSIGGHRIPTITTEMEVIGDKTHLTAQAKTPNDAILFYEVTRHQTDKLTEVNATIDYKHRDIVRSNRVYFKRDLSEDANLIIKWLDSEKLTNNNLVGIEIEHNGTLEKFTTSSKIHVSKFGKLLGKAEFSKDDWESIVMNAELTTLYKSHEEQWLNFRFEGQDTRLSSKLNLINGKNKEIVTTLLLQSSPHYIATISVEEPYKGDTHLLLLFESEDGKLTSKAKVKNNMEFSLLGDYSYSVHPYHPYIHLTTHFPMLKDLTANLKGELTDGSADVSLLLNDNDNVYGEGMLHYENLFSFTSTLSLDSTFENFEDLLLEIKNSQDQISRKSAFTLAWAPEKKISVSGDYVSKDLYSSSDIDRQILLDVKLPLEQVQSMYLVMGLQADTDKADGQIGFDFNTDKVLDMDLNYNAATKKSVLLTVRKPKVMEYSLSQNDNGDLTENELYLNWNRDEPESNIRVKSTFKDISDSSRTDRSASLTLVHPARSIGLEHSHFQTHKSVVSAGKVFWNVDANSKLFYNLNLEDKSSRRNTFQNGDLAIGGPLRTIGFSGARRLTPRQRVHDVSLSWDLDNDKDKKISLNSKVSGSEQVNADITLMLPAHVKVDSKLIFNKGNTLFDGSTDISYNWDSRKFLTLFSKVESNPGSFNYFGSSERYNYSVQFGLKHPDTKVDVKFDSHLGISDESMTGSLGLDYLTSYRQNKNMALWLEIDKIKKQINILGTNPYKQIGISGSVLNENPLRLQAIATTDNEESFKATLDVDQTINKIRLGIDNSGNDVHITAFYPNKSAIQVDVEHTFEDGSHEEGILSLRLAENNLLLANLRWRPEMMKEIQENVIDVIYQGVDSGKNLLSEISRDIEREITRKHKELTTALAEDTKPIIDFVKKELNIIARQIKIFRRNLRRSEKNNDLYLNDLMKKVNGILDSADSLLNTAQKKSLGIIRSLIKPLNSAPEKLQALRNYPISDTYRQLVAKTSESFQKSVLALNQKLSSLQDEVILLVYTSVDQAASHPWIISMENKLQVLNELEIAPHIQKMLETLKDGIVVLGESELTKVIQPYVDEIIETISQDGIHTDALEMLTNSSNMVYQQAKWAYNYWEIDENLPQLVQSSLVTLHETIKEEIRDNLGHLVQLTENPLKVYDVDNGVIEVSLPLPIDVDRLDEMPDVSQYMEKSSNSVQQYVSDMQQFWPKSWSYKARNPNAYVEESDENFRPNNAVYNSQW